MRWPPRATCTSLAPRARSWRRWRWRRASACGTRAIASGSITVAGKQLKRADARTAIAAGAAGVPEDPVVEWVVPGLSVLEHLALGDLANVRKGLGIDWDRARERVRAGPAPS